MIRKNPEKRTDGAILTRIRSLLPDLGKTDGKVANFILANAETCISMNLAQLSACSGISEASIIRFCRKAGLSGFTDLRLSLASVARDLPHDFANDMNLNENTMLEDIPEKVITRSIKGLQDMLGIFDKTEYLRAVHAIRETENIVIFAMANAASVADDAMNKFVRLGKKCVVTSDAHLQMMIASSLNKTDLAIGISHSGRTKQTIEALLCAKQAGAQVLCITNHEASLITGIADIKLLTADYEKDFDSETMVSRLSQLALIDMLFLGVLVLDYEQNLERIKLQNEILAPFAIH